MLKFRSMDKYYATEKGQALADGAHRMDVDNYRMARITFQSNNKEELHEIVYTYINMLSYHAAWDFEVENHEQENHYIATVTFKSNGGVLTFNGIQKLHFSYDYTYQIEYLKENVK